MRFILAVAIASISGAASAQTQPATDLDMQAAYCLATTSMALEDLQVAGAGTVSGGPEEIAGLVDRKNRLATYVRVRILYVDATGIAAAINRAKIDVQMLRANPNLRDPQSRVGRCHDLSWLPF